MSIKGSKIKGSRNVSGKPKPRRHQPQPDITVQDMKKILHGNMEGKRMFFQRRQERLTGEFLESLRQAIQQAQDVQDEFDVVLVGQDGMTRTTSSGRLRSALEGGDDELLKGVMLVCVKGKDEVLRGWS